MKDKFTEYFKSSERVQELSDYVHNNFKLIQTKMISELRRKLDITPSMDNAEGYLSLMATLFARMFNEMVYSLAAMSQSMNIPASQMINQQTLKIFLDLYEGKNCLAGRVRTDVTEDLEGFRAYYYLKNIEELRECKAALPK